MVLRATDYRVYEWTDSDGFPSWRLVYKKTPRFSLKRRLYARFAEWIEYEGWKIFEYPSETAIDNLESVTEGADCHPVDEEELLEMYPELIMLLMEGR